MIYIFQLCFIAVLFIYYRRANNCYKILVLFQLVSFAAAPLVSNFVSFETPLTAINIIFCLINLFLIIAPWRKAKFETIEIENRGFFTFYKKNLYIILTFTIINNLVVLLIVMLFAGGAANFKARQGYTFLYDSIPYFGILFRFASVSRYLGLMALPICVYYIKEQNFKQAAKAFLMSLSTLIAAIAFYSRAQILSYVVLCVCLYFYVEHTLGGAVLRIARRVLKYLALAVVVVFVCITISRFNSPIMSHYGDRIPENSRIKIPALYSVFDYMSKGFPNGIMQLELHETKDVMMGEPLVYDLLMMLSYFHLTSWTTDDYAVRLNNAYNKPGLNAENDAGSFHGYTCRMIKTMGYICTLIFDLLYYRYVRRKSLNYVMSVKTLTILCFLLLASINSIFYSEYNVIIYPLIFYIVLSILYGFKGHRIVIKREWRI